MPVILHVPFTYFPDPAGGTEVYVAGLAKGLASQGYDAIIAAPGDTENSYVHDGIPVRRFPVGNSPDIAHAYGAPDHVAARAFKTIVDELRPDIIHLHARTAAVSEALIDVGRSIGAKIVFTYHTPTVSCPRGTMMHLGKTPCDGKLDRRRCVSCALAGLGVPTPLAGIAGGLPAAVVESLARWEGLGPPLSLLRVPGLISRALSRFHPTMEKVDQIVAVCDWVRDVLLRNGVKAEKIIVCRQGISGGFCSSAERTGRSASDLVRIAYFGRLDHTKGVDLLPAALRLVPDARIRCDLYLIRQSGADAEYADLADACKRDDRLAIHAALPPAEVGVAMAGYDAIVVPSRCLETGPLVVLEAFAAGVPVLGSNLGGIAELVEHDRTGALFPADDARALASLLADVASDPSRLDAWRRAITPPRTMTHVAAEMARTYNGLLPHSFLVQRAGSSLRAVVPEPSA